MGGGIENLKWDVAPTIPPHHGVQLCSIESGRLCGTFLAESSFTGQGPVEIIFISDGSVEPGLGFKATYQAQVQAPVIPQDPCEPNPCNNQGVCATLLGRVRCNCIGTGYTGQYCDEEIDECESAPCLNGGVCTDLVNGYACECDGTGYSGENCEVRKYNNIYLFTFQS